MEADLETETTCDRMFETGLSWDIVGKIINIYIYIYINGNIMEYTQLYNSIYIYMHIQYTYMLHIIRHTYIYIYAWGPRFPQSRLVLNDSFVQNYCFAIAKWLFCTFFLFSLYCQFRGPKFLGPRTLHVMKCYTHYISFLRFLFFHTK